MKDLDSGQKVNISLWVLRQGSAARQSQPSERRTGKTEG